MLGVGLVLLATAGAYYGYVTWIAGSDADLLTVAPVAGRSETLETLPPGVQRTAASGQEPAGQTLYPGTLLPARQWAHPRDSLDLNVVSLEGFTPVSEAGRPSIVGALGRATRIQIPVLEIDVAIEELQVQNLGDSQAYETPKFTVGHIPTTPNAGSHGNGWYFGHLESPLQGEGNVFSRLPQVSDLLRAGEDVHVLLESEGRAYLYLVSETNLVHQDDMSLYQAGDARVTLVTCFPRLRYDHRLLVTAQLIGFKPNAA
jgi:LPXTG-site transpeptidase (sortase) family protein